MTALSPFTLSAVKWKWCLDHCMLKGNVSKTVPFKLRFGQMLSALPCIWGLQDRAGWGGRAGGHCITLISPRPPLASPVPWHSVRLISFCSLYPHRLMNTLHLPGFSLIFVRGHYEKCESFFFFFLIWHSIFYCEGSWLQVH